MNISKNEIKVEFVELPPLEQLEREWLELEVHSDASFFISWSWIGCWLACLPEQIKPRLLRATKSGEIVGMGLLVSRHFRRHRFFPVKSLNLHATGDPSLDEITIEYNGFLVNQAFGAEIISQFYEYLIAMTDEWDEIHLDGIIETTATLLPSLTGLRAKRQKECINYVDLAAVRAVAGDYLSLLKQKCRQQIRRSIKEYEIYGPITLSTAANIDEAFVFLAGLKRLHQAHWQSRGKSGSFANSFLETFHEGLIRARFIHGEIQLICVKVGDRELGYLYYFIHHGQVLCYQSGFDYTICEKRIQNQPGLVVHSLAIRYLANQGHLAYDFLAGNYEYKHKLRTHSCEMEWIVLQRDLFKYRVENGLRRMKRKLIGSGLCIKKIIK